MVCPFFVALFKSFLRRWPRSLYVLICTVLVGYFLWIATQYYLPGKGFTCLIEFGGAPQLHRIRELRGVDYYVYRDSNGYDGQYYAQMAIKPLLRSRDLEHAVDNLPYRARRILFSWTAFVLGLGQPAWILQAYALQGIVAWLVLAWLLWRWFPPDSLNNLVRWAGTLFAWGMTMSVREALMDGPSLLLIAWGVALAEQGRRWASAGVLGVAGLGRETNLLAGLTLLPSPHWGIRPARVSVRGPAFSVFPIGGWEWREAARTLGRGAVTVLPLALWVGCLWYYYGVPSNTGEGNFGTPFAAFAGKWAGAIRELRLNGWDSSAKWTLLMLVSLSVQFLVIALRPQWPSLWWRIGAPFALLLVLLGPAPWDGFPGAAARIVLPLTLAFNVVLPRGRWWWPVLLLGNLSALSAPDQLRPPGSEGYKVTGPREVWQSPARQSVEVEFSGDWYQAERSHLEYWQWSRGSAGMVIRNPQPAPIEVELHFDLRAFDDRTIRVYEGKALRWEGHVGRTSTPVRLAGIRLEPGDNAWRFETDKPPVVPEGDTLRPVAFNLRNLVVRAVRMLDVSAPPSGPAPPPGR